MARRLANQLKARLSAGGPARGAQRTKGTLATAILSPWRVAA
jgi:hypothetical protein